VGNAHGSKRQKIGSPTAKRLNSIAVGNAHGSNGKTNPDPEGVEHQSDPYRVDDFIGTVPGGVATGY
jgi:hypothetical protein